MPTSAVRLQHPQAGSLLGRAAEHIVTARARLATGKAFSWWYEGTLYSANALKLSLQNVRRYRHWKAAEQELFIQQLSRHGTDWEAIQVSFLVCADCQW